jgi:hypothetical protein
MTDENTEGPAELLTTVEAGQLINTEDPTPLEATTVPAELMTTVLGDSGEVPSVTTVPEKPTDLPSELVTDVPAELTDSPSEPVTDVPAEPTDSPSKPETDVPAESTDLPSVPVTDVPAEPTDLPPVTTAPEESTELPPVTTADGGPPGSEEVTGAESTTQGGGVFMTEKEGPGDDNQQVTAGGETSAPDQIGPREQTKNPDVVEDTQPTEPATNLPGKANKFGKEIDISMSYFRSNETCVLLM